MPRAKIGLIVIGDRRPDYLTTCLSSDLLSRFEVYDFPAVYPISEERDGYDLFSFRSRLAREPLNGEIGCALAHREALKGFIETSQLWTLVLEDDAIVIEPDRLEEIVLEIANLSESQPTVISLCYERAFPKRSQNKYFVQCRSFSSKTTAYFINRKGAEALIESQTPVRFLADWPITTLLFKFYVSRSPLVIEDPTLESSILNRPRSLSWLRTIQIYSGIWFLINRRSFQGFREYVAIHIKPRWLYHLTSLKLLPSLGNQ